jgi:hypothetical protein
MQFTVVIHSLLRWAVLVLGFLVVIKAFSGRKNKTAYGPSDNKYNLFFMISCDIQLLLGLVLYFGNGWLDVLKNLSSAAPETKSYNRFFAMEHMSMMIIAWVLVHVGRVVVKKSLTDEAKHKKSLLYFGLALFIILISIPWPFRQALHREWLPSF